MKGAAMAVQNVASTSLVQMAYIKEVTNGQTPSIGKGQDLRFTGESLSQTITKETSKEIEASRQTRSMFLTNAEVGGGLNFELSSGTYDDFLEALLMGPWSTFGTNGKVTAGSTTFAVSGSTYTITTTNALTGLEVGDYFSVTGTNVNAANRGPHRVKSISPDKKIVTVFGPVEVQTVAAATVNSGKLTNGTTVNSFTLEKRYTDINQTFVYRGMRVSKGSFPFEMRAAITGSFDFTGKTSAVTTGLTLGDKTAYNTSTTTPVIDSVIGMKDVLFNGVPTNDRMSAGLTKVNLDIDNKLQALGGIGVLGSVDVMTGTLSVSGSMEMYLNNAELYNSVLTQERFRVEWSCYDKDGHGYAFVLPSVELDSPESNVGQKDEGAVITVKFNALMDPTTQKTVFIYRF